MIREKYSVAHLDLSHVSGASGSNLSAPSSAGFQVIGGSSPLSLLDQAVEGGEASKTSLSQVVGHVDENILGALACNTGAIDSSLSTSGGVEVSVEKLFALWL